MFSGFSLPLFSNCPTPPIPRKRNEHTKNKTKKNSNICLVKKIITTEKQQERKLQRGKFPDLCVGSKHLSRRLSAAMLPLLPLDRFPLTHPLTRKPQYVGGGVLLPNLKYQWGCQINKGMEATGYTRPGKRLKKIIAGSSLITNLLQLSHFTDAEINILRSGKFIIISVKPSPKQKCQIPIIYTSQENFASPRI